MQALWKLALEPIAETLADPNSYGFRPERSTADAIAQCFTCLAQSTAPTWILEGDIRGCFDNFDHSWLLKHIPIQKSILQQWLKAGYIEKGTLFATTAGTPQGGIISPVLANMALDGLEAAVHASVGLSISTRRKFKLHVIRYADDFVITATSKEVLVTEVLPAVKRFLAERGLELSEEKTAITRIAEGFDFLGQNVRKYDGKLLIKPAKKSIKSLLDKVREVIKKNASSTQEVLIRQLNRITKGWAMYHRHIVAKATYVMIDSKIWTMLWNWARRRHPTKGAQWVKNRYFHVIGNRTWDFSVQIAAEGHKYFRLFRMATVSITRHVKIRGAATPFDPAWTDYFTQRHAKKHSSGLSSADAWC